MKLKLMTAAFFLLAVGAWAGEKVEKLYKTFTINPTAIGIACKDGSKPAVREDLGFVVISCK